LSFTKEALPIEGINIETDKGDMKINLPIVDLYLDYKQQHEGMIIVNNSTKFKEESGNTKSVHIPGNGPVLRLYITTTDAEIEINTGNNLPINSESIKTQEQGQTTQ
jgi:hypothetical protein